MSGKKNKGEKKSTDQSGSDTLSLLSSIQTPDTQAETQIDIDDVLNMEFDEDLVQDLGEEIKYNGFDPKEFIQRLAHFERQVTELKKDLQLMALICATRGTNIDRISSTCSGARAATAVRGLLRKYGIVPNLSRMAQAGKKDAITLNRVKATFPIQVMKAGILARASKNYSPFQGVPVMLEDSCSHCAFKRRAEKQTYPQLFVLSLYANLHFSRFIADQTRQQFDLQAQMNFLKVNHQGVKANDNLIDDLFQTWNLQGDVPNARNCIVNIDNNLFQAAEQLARDL
jgi:hypothetical protein